MPAQGPRREAWSTWFAGSRVCGGAGLVEVWQEGIFRFHVICPWRGSAPMHSVLIELAASWQEAVWRNPRKALVMGTHLPRV